VSQWAAREKRPLSLKSWATASVKIGQSLVVSLGLTQVALARHLGVPTQRINELIRGKRGVTPETAWLLAGAFGTTPQFWLNLQSNYDLATNRPKRTIQPLALAA
jgi:antitoxin HigA-1